MKKQTILNFSKKIIVLVFLSSLILPPATVKAENLSNLYSNPNQNNKFEYRFKASDVINGQVLTSVVGCTGAVDTVAGWMTKLVQSKKKAKEILKNNAKKVTGQLEDACANIKASAQSAAGAAPVVNDQVSTVDTIFSKVKMGMFSVGTGEDYDPVTGVDSGQLPKPPTDEKTCLEQVKSINPELMQQMIDDAEEEQKKNMKEQCFDGIAIALAKNQLTALTRSAMNWVNSGYGGNPFFVQNMRRLTTGIERNVLETGMDILLDPGTQSPYARDFARSRIAYRGIVSSSAGLLGNLTSTMGNFITDPRSYYSNGQLQSAINTETAVQRSIRLNDSFANNFSLGGWNAWLAFTQIPQNNPLGYNMLANQYLADIQAQQIADVQNELSENNGFMSQKECVKWQIYNADGTPKRQLIPGSDRGGLQPMYEFVYSNRKPGAIKPEDGYGECTPDGWKVTTPGSLIKDKVSNYLNSPERQLELVKTINDSLNALFSVLITKMEQHGLSGLSDAAVDTNWTDSMNSLTSDENSNSSTYDNGGAYNNFNLTRDLGNTYIHDAVVSYGTWNARTNWVTSKNSLNNNKKLYPEVAPEIYNEDGNPVVLSNIYFTVDTPGKTKLITEGYNNWEVGDRAFWDGSKWQNWKKGQQSPIANRGVIQIQQDYIVAAKEISSILPNVMTKLGELDYCIPGPNLNYKTNSMDTQSAYQDWIGSIYTGPKDYTDTNRMSWEIDRESSRTFKNLKNIFNDNPNTWKTLYDSNAIAWFLNYFGPFTGTKWEGVASYAYKDHGITKFQEAQKLQEINNNYVNNSLFQNFYEVFDKMMNKIYFNKMTTQYLDTETSIGINKNPAYIPMAESGLSLTKDILYYNSETSQKIKDYTNAISEAKTNIAKLQPIRDEVSGIIKAAQDRRNENMQKILNDEAKRTGGKVLTKEEFKKKYADCLEEENIQVFDADGIIGRGTKAEENCSDDIDNDLNGLTDNNDPACPNYAPTNNNSTGRRQ